MDESRRGLLLGVGAYLCWGLFPLYWPLLEPAGADEVLAHRIVWSLVFVAVLVSVTGRWRTTRAAVRDRRRVVYLAVGSVAVAVNWGMFIWAVNNGHVIETSLGYFINPLVTILMGVVVLGERLRAVQWSALSLAVLAVAVLAIDYGRPPYIALVLAFSFGTYGLMKKRANIGALEGLAVETAALAPLAVTYLAVSEAGGDTAFGHEGWLNILLLAATGVVTAIPLLLFGGAATRVSLTTVGLLQYITPIMQFLLGLIVFGEDMTSVRWLGFVLVWVALSAITVEAVANRRRVLSRAAEDIAC
ncbi:MAG: EamA family transporter RarD [Nocardioidaceae bacterium]